MLTLAKKIKKFKVDKLLAMSGDSRIKNTNRRVFVEVVIAVT